MREILFKGKRIDNNEWIYGDLLQIKTAMRNRGTSIMEQILTAVETEVDLETVGQYTGLRDTNGVKIFEDDIMSINQYGNVLVEIQDGCAGAFADGGFIPFRKSIWGVGGVVVGNIHDNPELLELE